jgi:hypothetical protein
VFATPNILNLKLIIRAFGVPSSGGCGRLGA